MSSYSGEVDTCQGCKRTFPSELGLINASHELCEDCAYALAEQEDARRELERDTLEDYTDEDERRDHAQRMSDFRAEFRR
jgi:hypothetical protein